MSENDIQSRIIALICNDILVGVSIDEVNNDSSLINDLHLDSIQIMELITKLEKEFSIELDDEDLDFEHFSSINSLASFVQSNQD